ncbi:TlpA disulfide reductase family protein [Zoogloea sp.]|uniref:TlpA family protein disulfide reductase n=1 Tax=Zoogloea sp. TaxID=49181 RepID=UPI0025D10095|nr:TlpA disulfide reductase family protein [Zoogloea sp.]MCK6393473.1 TlpA family protein disulfide reductase [Zoogloea sp.]
MKRGIRFLLVVIVAFAAGAAGLYAARQSPSSPPVTPALNAAVGKLMALDLPDTTGKQQPLAQWQGKVLVVNFWATWCPPCRKEIPAFSALSRKYADKGVQFVGISIDTPKNVIDFQAAQKVAYPLVIASPSVVGLTEELGNASQGLPFTLILDRKGNISLVKLGMLSEEELDRKLAELSKG